MRSYGYRYGYDYIYINSISVKSKKGIRSRWVTHKFFSSTSFELYTKNDVTPVIINGSPEKITCTSLRLLLLCNHPDGEHQKKNIL